MLDAIEVFQLMMDDLGQLDTRLKSSLPQLTQSAACKCGHSSLHQPVPGAGTCMLHGDRLIDAQGKLGGGAAAHRCTPLQRFGHALRAAVDTFHIQRCPGTHSQIGFLAQLHAAILVSP